MEIKRGYILDRSVLLNWSERRHWLKRFTLSNLAFSMFGGSEEFNPLAVVFRPLRSPRTFRFFQAFKDYKHGNGAALQKLELEFLKCAGYKKGV